MIIAKLHTEEWEVDKRLAAFGVSKEELIDVVRSTLAERQSAVDVDVLNAPGMLSYIHGTRHLRFLLLSKGYRIHREKNVEACWNEETGIKVVFQNVDQAANRLKGPRAISGKRSGSAQAIESAQGTLFSENEAPEAISSTEVDRLHSAVWYLCVSFEEDSVRAELSLPAGVKNGNFVGFLERIFLIEGGDWASISFDEFEADDVVDMEPRITRKTSNA